MLSTLVQTVSGLSPPGMTTSSKCGMQVPARRQRSSKDTEKSSRVLASLEMVVASFPQAAIRPFEYGTNIQARTLGFLKDAEHWKQRRLAAMETCSRWVVRMGWKTEGLYPTAFATNALG